MPNLPKDPVFREHVREELWRQFRSSIARKIGTFLVTLLAIGAMFGLDALRLRFIHSHLKPYLVSTFRNVVGAASASSPKNAELRDLQNAAAALEQTTRYDTPDHLYTDLLTKIDLSAAQNDIRKDYTAQLSAIDKEIGATPDGPTRIELDTATLNALKAHRNEIVEAEKSELADSDQKEGPKIRAAYAKRLQESDREIAKTLDAVSPLSSVAVEQRKLASWKARRATLIAELAAKLAEADQKTETRKAALRRAFDGLHALTTVKENFIIAKNERLSGMIEHIVDPEDALSVIYQVLWYASLIIGVVTFVALFFSPLFKTLPVTGAEQPFTDQVKTLFSRGARTIGVTAAQVAAVVVGGAAIVSVTGNAPANPVTSLQRAAAQASIVSEEHSQEKGSKPNTVSEKSSPSPPKQEPPPPPFDGKPPASPPETLHGDLEKIGKSLEQLNASSATAGTTLNKIDQKLPSLIDIPGKVSSLEGTDSKQNGNIENVFGKADDAERSATEAKSAAANAIEQARLVDANVKTAAEHIEDRAKMIDEEVVLPYKIGERPGFFQSLLGFDRYRVTDASIDFVRKAGAPEDVVTAIGNLDRTHNKTRDEMLIDFRRQVCGQPANCPLFRAWRTTVLRASRRS